MLIHLNDDPSFFNLLDQCIVAALMILPYLLSNSCYKLDTITTTRRLYDSDDETETGGSNRKQKRTTRMKNFEDAKRKKISPIVAQGKLVTFVSVIESNINNTFFVIVESISKFFLYRAAQRKYQ